MTLFEKITTEGDERADELAKDGSMLDGGEMATSEPVQSSRKARRFTRHHIAKSPNRNPQRSGSSWNKHRKQRSIARSGLQLQPHFAV